MKDSTPKEVSLVDELRDEISNMKMRTLESDAEDYGLLFSRGGGSRPRPNDPIQI